MKKLCIIMLISIIMLTGCGKSTGRGEPAEEGVTTPAINETTDVTKKESGQTPETESEQPPQIDEYITAKSTWAYDVTDPESVFGNADYFIKVKVLTKDETKYFVENTWMPSSTYTMEVLDTLSPENTSLLKNIKVAVGGGVITMEEFASRVDLQTKEKMKIDNLSKEDLQKHVLISNDSYYELEQGKEYYICIIDITQDDDYKGYYGMPEGGYDVFQEKDGLYVNVLTQKTLLR